MTKAELYEEMRTELREAQASTVTTPWLYDDKDFVPQIRSALRQIRSMGLAIGAVMDTTGEFTTEPTEVEGMLIAYKVVHRLLSGDLIQKLTAGELGIIYKSGSDLIDTRGAASAFNSVASQMDDQFRTLFLIVMTGLDGGAESVYGLTTDQSEAVVA